MVAHHAARWKTSALPSTPSWPPLVLDTGGQVTQSEVSLGGSGMGMDGRYKNILISVFSGVQRTG